ncbi:MAG: hypothetical protein DME03_01945 [Candidatus Rokuibacteriota bacterium]|nr:MAG: hypothetical protein DME03_01945 [Candidatus Rokubacteria bacterium]
MSSRTSTPSSPSAPCTTPSTSVAASRDDHRQDRGLLRSRPADRRERLNLVRKWTGGVGADVACDFVGFPQVIAEGIEMLRSGGTYLEIGTISRGAKVELEPSLLVWGSKTIVGVIQYDPGTIPRALDFLVRNRVRWPFDRLISHTYPLENINQAFADSEWHAKETTSITRAALAP